MRREKRIAPSLWVSRKPFGLGEQHPNNYNEIWRAVSENRDQLAYAWRILKHGVCDGCSLGTTGVRDWTLDEVHLCNVRLRLLRLNTMPALDVQKLSDVAGLRSHTGAELRQLGRLPFPMLRQAGEPGFRRVSWDHALGLIAERIRGSSPGRLGFYMTSRGQPNENYYAAQKAVRAMGCNSIDNAARLCHSPSTFGLKHALGVAATTCSYKDWIGSDLVVFIGSNVATNQPVSMKYLYHAKKAGTKVVVNAYREPGMERYPTADGKAHFGTVEPTVREIPEGMFIVASRRGRQFNSMIQSTRDDHTGAARDAVLISREDADSLGISDGDGVLLASEVGEYRGRAHLAPVKSGTLQVHWPEGEVLIDHVHRARAGAPDYNAIVRLTPLDGDRARVGEPVT